MRQRVFEQESRRALALRPRVLDLFAEAELQLARGLLGEGDGDDFADAGAALAHRVDHPRHEFRRLAGAGGGLHDERGVEVRPDARAVLVIDEPRPSRTHFILRSCVSSASGR